VLDKEQWGEFVKCLDLFCQEVISRQELLDLVKDLFEDENLEVYDQFTQVLTDRGVVENPMEEVWFSMPLSEIDFSQCRKCTPSYRALPSGYPIPPCSERSTMEQSVLNDNWVSVRLLLSYTKLHESTYTHTHTTGTDRK
jgi:paired amphipathic helix protein Sin3a